MGVLMFLWARDSGSASFKTLFCCEAAVWYNVDDHSAWGPRFPLICKRNIGISKPSNTHGYFLFKLKKMRQPHRLAARISDQSRKSGPLEPESVIFLACLALEARFGDPTHCPPHAVLLLTVYVKYWIYLMTVRQS